MASRMVADGAELPWTLGPVAWQILHKGGQILGDFGVAFSGGLLRGLAQSQEASGRRALEKEELDIRNKLFKLREQESALSMRKLQQELLGRGGLAEQLLGGGGREQAPTGPPVVPQPRLPTEVIPGAGRPAPPLVAEPVFGETSTGIPFRQAPPLVADVIGGGEAPGGLPFAPQPRPAGGVASPADAEQAGRRRLAASMILAGLTPPAELLTGGRPVTVGPGQQLVDPNTGRAIASVPPTPRAPVSVAPGGTLVDPSTGRPIFQAPQAEPKAPATATELNDLALTLKGKDFRALSPGERLEVSTALEKQKREFETFKAGLRAQAEPSPGKRIVELSENLRQQGLLRNDFEEADFIRTMTVRPSDLQRIFQGDFQTLEDITGEVRQRIQQRQTPSPTATAQRRQGAAPGAQAPAPGPTGPVKRTPPANFEFPAEVQTTSQAITYSMLAFGMSEKEAREFVKKQQGAPSGKKAR